MLDDCVARTLAGATLGVLVVFEPLVVVGFLIILTTGSILACLGVSRAVALVTDFIGMRGIAECADGERTLAAVIAAAAATPRIAEAILLLLLMLFSAPFSVMCRWCSRF